jgi:hypothetical protein
MSNVNAVGWMLLGVCVGLMLGLSLRLPSQKPVPLELRSALSAHDVFDGDRASAQIQRIPDKTH